MQTSSPPARPPYRSRSASEGQIPPRPRPSIGPTAQPGSSASTQDTGRKAPIPLATLQTAGPSRFPVQLPFRPPLLPQEVPFNPQKAEEWLTRAAEMSRNPDTGTSSQVPAAPSQATTADLQKITAPKAPPKNPGPKGLQRPISNMTTISIDDEQLFQATQRSSYEQLREQITQRAKGRNAVDYYEEGMTPLLSYMFFVLHYHENFLTTKKLHQWPIMPHNKMRHFTDRVVFVRQNSLPVSKVLRNEVEEVVRLLLSRFGAAGRPFVPIIPIGQKEIVTLARAVIASKIPYRHICQHDVKAFAVPQTAPRGVPHRPHART